MKAPDKLAREDASGLGRRDQERTLVKESQNSRKDLIGTQQTSLFRGKTLRSWGKRRSEFMHSDPLLVTGNTNKN